MSQCQNITLETYTKEMNIRMEVHDVSVVLEDKLISAPDHPACQHLAAKIKFNYKEGNDVDEWTKEMLRMARLTTDQVDEDDEKFDSLTGIIDALREKNAALSSDVKARREREDNYLTRIAELEHQNGELQGEISQLQIDLAAANVLNGNGGDVDLPLTIKIQERGLYDIGVQLNSLVSEIRRLRLDRQLSQKLLITMELPEVAPDDPYEEEDEEEDDAMNS